MHACAYSHSHKQDARQSDKLRSVHGKLNDKIIPAGVQTAPTGVICC